MRLLDTLAETIEQEDSPFRVQLLREDIKRLQSIRDACASCDNDKDLQQVSVALNWTASQEQTDRLAAQICSLSDAIWQWHLARANRDQHESRIEQAWLTLHNIRLELMVGCLSMPVSKPVD